MILGLLIFLGMTQWKAVSLTGTLLVIPTGSYNMGSTEYEAEQPIHTVNIKSFYIQETVVTWDQYLPCISAGKCSQIPDEGWGLGDRPVIGVSWYDTQKYIGWLNQTTGKKFRLPTESEWEYAARAGSTTTYNWGSDVGKNKASCDGCGSPWDNDKTAPVKSFNANAFGLYGVHGNVWEWVQDCWKDSYEDASNDGSALNEEACYKRILRGGSFGNSPKYLSSALRYRSPASKSSIIYGFRLALDKPEINTETL